MEKARQISEIKNIERLEKIYIKTPRGVELEVNWRGVQVTRDGAMMPYMYFDKNRYFQLDDVELDIESLFEENHRKNGVEITLPSLSGFGEIEFHISFKETFNFVPKFGQIRSKID